MAGLNLPSLRVDILADGSSAIREIDGVVAAAQSLEIVGTKFKSFATDRIVAGLKSAVSGASDLQETLGKTEVIFGDMTDDVLDWSETSIDAMGLAQSTALDMVALYADMATGMGFTTGEAKSMSTSMTQLAADLASFKNISIADVQTKLNGVFTGETEALKSLGVVMTQANLQQFALTQGITKQISAMTQAEQVQLRYNYVMAMTANAQGDFARTGDSLANQTRKLQQTIKQLGESFGSLLTEQLAGIVEKLQSAVQWVTDLDEGTKRTIVTIGLVVAAVGPLLIVTGKIVTAVATLKAAMSALAASPIMLAIMGVTAAAGALAAGLMNANKEIDTTSAEYKRFADVVNKGANGKVTVDDSEVTAANGTDGAIAKLKENIAKLEAKITVEQDPEKKRTLNAELETLKTELSNLENTRKLNINSDRVAEIDTEIAGLRDDIDDLRGQIEIEQDPEKKTALEGQLNELEGRLNGLELTRSIIINASGNFVELDDAEERMTRFDALLKKMPRDEEYGGTGKFVIPEGTEDEIEAYGNALMYAASATGNYTEAVKEMDALVDAQLKREIESINRQAAVALEDTVTALKAGAISEEEAVEQTQKIMDDKKRQIAEQEEIAKKKKEMHAGLADGSLANDAQVTLDIAKDVYKNSEIRPEVYTAALDSLRAADKSGADMTQLQTEGQIALAGALNKTKEAQTQLTAAEEEYYNTVNVTDRNAETKRANAEETVAFSQEMARIMTEIAAMEGVGASPEQAMANAFENNAESLERFAAMRDTITAAMSDTASGELAGYDELITKIQETEAVTAEAQNELANIETETAQAKADAQSALTERVNAIQQFLDPDEIYTVLELAQATGAAISEMDAQMIAGGTQAVDDLASALASGEGDIESALGVATSSFGAFKSMASASGRSIGVNLISGITAGMRGEVYNAKAEIRAAVRSMVNAAKVEARIFSPSHVMRDEVGAMLMKGMGVGIKEETPNVAKAIRESLDGIIGGAVAVINKGSYAIPAIPIYGAAAAGASAGTGGGFDYERMADAVSRRPISFSVGSRELADATREETARAQAVRVAQINAGFGGR